VNNTVFFCEYSAQTAEAPYRPVGFPVDLSADPKRAKSLSEFLGVITDPAVGFRVIGQGKDNIHGLLHSLLVIFSAASSVGPSVVVSPVPQQQIDGVSPFGKAVGQNNGDFFRCAAAKMLNNYSMR